VTGESTESLDGKVIAFYSFKGGTGRSMALANIACTMARSGASQGPVLVVDWDLEAPGLHRYLAPDLYKAFGGSESAQNQFPGLLELFSELSAGLGNSSAEDPQDEATARTLVDSIPLEEYIIATDRPGLYLLKSGRYDAGYAARIASLDWRDLYTRSPHLLRSLAERLGRTYRHVLIDSRTGFTDTSGICTMLMPEVLVVVFTPNRQSMGVLELVREASAYRARSGDLRPLLAYPLPSRIESTEPSLRQLWRFGDAAAGIVGYQPAFESVFAEVYGLEHCSLQAYFDDVQIQHVPRFAYGEAIAVNEEESKDRFSMTSSFVRFTERLVDGQPPWGVRAPADPAAVADDDSPLMATSGQARNRATKAFLHGAESWARATSAAARRYRILSTCLEVLASSSAGTVTVVIALSLGGSTALLTGPFGITVLALAAIVATGLVANTVFRPERRATALSRALFEWERERRSFDSGDPPYSGDNALALLQWRLTQLQADPTLAQPRSRGPRDVYISYRRGDADLVADALFDALVQSLGEGHVFMDVQGIAPGDDFAKVLADRIDAADVVLALIGPGWGSMADNQGRRRLDNPYDFVRMELALALRRRKRVIPVLVMGVTMPSPEALPSELAPLTSINAFELNQRRLEFDVRRLIEVIHRSGAL